MAGTWIYSDTLPHLCTGDITRDRHTYEGETLETGHLDTWDTALGDITEMWQVTDITRNGWYTLTRNVRARTHAMWEETGETRRVRGRKNLPLMIVSLDRGDHRWKDAYAS